MTDDDWRGEGLIRGQRIPRNGQGSNMRYRLAAKQRTKERDEAQGYTPKSPRFAGQKKIHIKSERGDAT